MGHSCYIKGFTLFFYANQNKTTKKEAIEDIDNKKSFGQLLN